MQETILMFTSLLSFALFAAIIAITPGPDSLLVLRNGVLGGRRAGLWTGVGAAGGSLVWGVAAAVGLATLLQQWSMAYTLVKYAGALYLAYLGLQSLLQRHSPAPEANVAGQDQEGLPAGEAFRTGLWSNLLNPKVGLFFLAVAPQFLPDGYSPFHMTLLFGAVDAVIAFAWLSTLAYGISRALRWLRRPRIRLYLERTTGVFLIGLAVTSVLD
jgi:threonine/homoserine/homoserine lactone efflux protein